MGEQILEEAPPSDTRVLSKDLEPRRNKAVSGIVLLDQVNVVYYEGSWARKQGVGGRRINGPCVALIRYDTI